jgi:hypothetical protein
MKEIRAVTGMARNPLLGGDKKHWEIGLDKVSVFV